jgi:fumarate hydratase class I
VTAAEFRYSDLLPTAGSNGAPETPYRLITTEGVSTQVVGGRTFLQVEPEAIRRLTEEAMHDISHYLRPGHLAQLRRIIDDPEASGNDRFVALDLLKNVNISAGGVLPMCQDTGTAIVMGKKSEGVLTGADDGEAISRGVYDAYTRLNLRYSQLAPLTTFEEKNTGTNLPAQIELYSTPAQDTPEYKFLFMAKGGGSANKSFLFQETKAVLNPTRLMEFLDEKIRSLGTAACPPYHLAVVIGGTSAEFALKTAKYASAHYLDDLPTSGSMSAHGIRDVELEESASARSSAGSTSATTSAWSGSPATAPPAPSPSRCPAPPTGRRSGRSPPRASSSSSSRPTPRSTCPTRAWPTTSRAARSSRSTSTSRWPTSSPSSRSTR